MELVLTIIIIIFLIAIIVLLIDRMKMVSKIRKIDEILKSSIEGDFTVKFKKGNHLLDKTISISYNSLVDTIKKFLCDTYEMGNKIDLNANMITDNTASIKEEIFNSSKFIENISSQFDTQSQNVNMTVIKTEEMAKDFNKILEGTAVVSEKSREVNSILSDNIKIFDELDLLVTDNTEIITSINDRMKDLIEKVDEIGGIAETVSDISDNTNLLALNASIEAARAGDAGKGFAVVAEEVKKLAEESAKNAEEIESILFGVRDGVNEIYKEIKNSTESMKRTQKTSNSAKEDFTKTLSQTQETVEITHEIFELSKNEHKRVIEIEELMTNLNKFLSSSTFQLQEISSKTQEEAASVDEIFTRLNELSVMTSKVENDVKKFSRGYKLTNNDKENISKGLNILKEFSKRNNISELLNRNCDREVKEVMDKYPIFETVNIFDLNGDTKGVAVHKIISDLLGFKLPDYHGNFAHREYFKKARDGEVYKSEAYISSDSYNYCVALAVPIHENSKVIGVVMADFMLVNEK